MKICFMRRENKKGYLAIEPKARNCELKKEGHFCCK